MTKENNILNISLICFEKVVFNFPCLDILFENGFI